MKLTKDQIDLLKTMGNLTTTSYSKSYTLPHEFIDNEDGTFTVIIDQRPIIEKAQDIVNENQVKKLKLELANAIWGPSKKSFRR